MVGASGFEPPASWSRTNHVNPIKLYLGVAYWIQSVISSLLVVPNLYLHRFSVESRSRRGKQDSAFRVAHSSSDSQKGILGGGTAMIASELPTIYELVAFVTARAFSGPKHKLVFADPKNNHAVRRFL
jgi:hypothetical protein